ncbi:MAG: aminoglycoside phosphotransferase family protein [Nanoarchaeota archaeon]
MEKIIPEIIEKEFKAKTLEIIRINEGFSHYVYSIKFNKKPFEAIIRFSNNKKEEYGLGKEKWVIETLSKANIPAPKIYAFNNSENGYIILEKFRGQRLDSIWDSLNKKDKLQLTEEIGKLAAKMHNIELEAFGKILSEGKIEEDIPFKFRKAGEEIEFDKSLRYNLVEFMKDFARLVSYSSVSKETALKAINQIITNLHEIRYEGKPRILHGDFHTGHIFVEKNNEKYEITGLIDFEFAKSSTPEYDFIKLHRQGFFDDKELFNALQEGYGRTINFKAVKIYRLMRDLGFAQVMLDAGNKEQADKTLKFIEESLSDKSNF